jgi:hypothetical protein
MQSAALLDHKPSRTKNGTEQKMIYIHWPYPKDCSNNNMLQPWLDYDHKQIAFSHP